MINILKKNIETCKRSATNSYWDAKDDGADPSTYCVAQIAAMSSMMSSNYSLSLTVASAVDRDKAIDCIKELLNDCLSFSNIDSLEYNMTKAVINMETCERNEDWAAIWFSARVTPHSAGDSVFFIKNNKQELCNIIKGSL